MSTPTLPTRRAFLGTAATLAAATLLPRHAFAAAAKPNSVFNGVRIGAITYSYRSMFTSAQETLGGVLQCGLSEIELMGGPIQQFAGMAVLPPGAKKWVAFHNHTANLPAMGARDPILELSPYIGFNLDIGHYVAGTKGKSPIPVLEKYHDRITNLHLKDRTADGGNVPWGQGQTPIKEVLQLMKKEKWTFPAEIELEYKIPEGSDAVKEVAKCVQ
jgi:hypothetical protein